MSQVAWLDTHFKMVKCVQRAQSKCNALEVNASQTYPSIVVPRPFISQSYPLCVLIYPFIALSYPFIALSYPFIAGECKPARRTAKEISHYKGVFKGEHNLSRLRTRLLSLAFTPTGQWQVHAECLRAEFNVGKGWLANLHRSALKQSGVSTAKKTKEYVIKWGLENDVLVDQTYSDHSQKQYLAKMGHLDLVEIVLSAKGKHRLSNQASNNAATPTKQMFITFVLSNRSSTGRTADKQGRYHGAEYYLSPRFKQLKKQTGKGRNNAVSDDQIFTEVFLSQLPSGARKVNRSTVAVWLSTEFGIGSRLQHTTLHPHKTAACPLCCQYCEDLASCEITLEMETNQHNLTPEREETMRQLRESIADIAREEKLHGIEAGEAQQAYRNTIKDAHKMYSEFCQAWDGLLRGAPSMGPAELDKAIDIFCILVAGFIFVFSSDYQQDKMWPAWNSSPQPGPTYFLSKITEYVMLICAESCGETEGKSRFGRNRAYLRQETIGGAKDANDTVSTLFDFLLAVRGTTCEQPPLHRSGYSEDAPTGRGRQEAPPEPAMNTSGAHSHSIIPEGHTIVSTVPLALDALALGSDLGNSLVGASILYKGSNGWVCGEVSRQITDRQRRDPITKKPPNYAVTRHRPRAANAHK